VTNVSVVRDWNLLARRWPEEDEAECGVVLIQGMPEATRAGEGKEGSSLSPGLFGAQLSDTSSRLQPPE
jgi:hypothetical protein